MRTVRGRVRTVVAAALILVALGSGIAGAQGPPKPGGTLVVAQYEPGWWNPLLEAGAPFVNRLVYIGLTDYDKDGNVAPGLAESWTISKDGLVYTFVLRRDVKWHDGKPFTAADVKFTYEKILDPKSGSWLRGFFDPVTQVDTPDDYTVVLRLRAPSATLLYNTWHGILPRHVWEKEDLSKGAHNATPVGTGPFKVAQWARGDHVVLVANDGYFRGRPYLDKVILKTIPDTAVTFAALERGEVHYLPPFGIIGGVPYHQVKALETKPNLQVSVTETTQTQYLYLKLDKPPFDNLKVRQAVAHAINKQEVADRMTAGYGKLLDSRVPPVIGWAHNASVKTYPYDVAEANRLLDEAGLKRGADGIRIRTKIYAKPGPRLIMSELFREHLRAVGIDAEITTSDWATYIGTSGIAGRWTACGRSGRPPTSRTPRSSCSSSGRRRSSRAAGTTSSTRSRDGPAAGAGRLRRGAPGGRCSGRSRRSWPSWRASSRCSCSRRSRSGTGSSRVSSSSSTAGGRYVLWRRCGRSRSSTAARAQERTGGRAGLRRTEARAARSRSPRGRPPARR